MSTNSAKTTESPTSPDPAAPAKSSILMTIVRCVTTAALLIASAAGLWQYFSTKAANSQIVEANKHYEQGVAIHNEAVPKLKAYTEAVQSFPSSRPDLERQARELAEMYGRAAEQYRSAATKIGEAAETEIDVDVSGNYKARVNYLTKCAEIRDTLGKYVLLVADPTVKSAEDLAARQAELDARVVVLTKEEKDLQAVVDKTFSDHRSKFE
jgi:vacuolar-type H+-ATPase subunit I/STV1